MRRSWRWCWTVGAVLVVGLLAGCPQPGPPPVPTPPPPTPTPTPTPTPAPDVEARPAEPVGTLEQRQEGGRFRYPVTGFIPVWPPDVDGQAPRSFVLDGKAIPYLWSIFSEEWSDAIAGKVPHATLYIRIGPEPKSDSCCGLEDVGGPLVEGDPTRANPAYLRLMHRGLHRTVKNEQMVLVSIGPDGWRLKHAIWAASPQLTRAAPSAFDRYALRAGLLRGDGVHVPWTREQLAHAMDVPLAPFVDDHVKRWVFETCNYVNVSYEISNESALTPGWTPAWERAMYAAIRQHEQQPGCGRVVHMISGDQADPDGPYDGFVSHNPNEGLVVGNVPLVVNEYNPALAPSTVNAKVREWRDAGQAFWYWRSDGSDADFQRTIDLLAGTTEQFQCDVRPLPDVSKLRWWMDCSRQQSCDATPFIEGDHDHCVAVGMGTWPDGSWRWNCPLANEGDPRRLPCEQWAMQRWAPLWKSDGQVTLVDAGGFRARTTGSWLQACDASGERCSAQVEAP